MKAALFCFENIGQGLFYHGRLHGKHTDSFDFIYDCGSKSAIRYLHTAIDSYRPSVKKLEMVVISHFDEDHVNGVTRLISGKRVDRLILPYVTWAERLALRTMTKSQDNQYLLILEDPLTYFGGDNFDIGEIIVVGGPDQPPADNPDLFIPGPPLEQVAINTETNELRVYIPSKALSDEDQVTQLPRFTIAWDPTVVNPWKLSLYKSPFSLFVGAFWEFHFYNVEGTDSAKMMSFERDLRKWMAKEKLEPTDLFKDEHRSTVRSIYTKHYSRLNQTSLILYHNAIEGQTNSAFTLNSVEYHPADEAVESTENTGTLLTGDLSLSAKKTRENLLAFYKHRIDRVGIFLVPHHAAKANWAFKHPSGLEDFEAYVVSAGVKRKHHPSPKVLDDIDAWCAGEIYHCHETCAYFYDVFLM
ncbi:hypothetical protein GWC95_15665 [Sediminibacterium roseum]|uniref:Metallo-beta-lactamase superfamily protein n=1 Tax=Sediminibacterium roseum TaxID=1978412 RepID=A0ABX0A2K9_9BACT|nr:hypothetical protein [Sediminibacterium roseum]NCI51366.1 hypothetical protein [Sediminibacterium roseum]